MSAFLVLKALSIAGDDPFIEPRNDGKFWVCDWVSGPNGNTTVNRYHIASRLLPNAM